MEGKKLDFYELATMTFEKPDTDTFKGLSMAYEAIGIGGSMPTVYNAANEKAVALFLDKKIKFLEIYDLIQGAMEHHKVITNPSVDEILASEQEAYEYIAGIRK